MLKRKDSAYHFGRKTGIWWKWKLDPLSFDAVLTYAQKGHGIRANLFSDFTFGIWKDEQLITITKAYTGLTNKELSEINKFINKHTIERFGPVRSIVPTLVFEIGFDSLQVSPRHKAGIALRFPRILRWRKDKSPKDADTIEQIKKLLPAY
jgi:DNA ligase-1